MPMPHAGELAALATALCWTGSVMAFEAAGRRVGSLGVNLIRLAMAYVFLVGFSWAIHGHPLPTDAPREAWIWLSISGFVGFTLGDLCLFRVLVILGSRITMLLMSLVPPMTALIDWVVRGEILNGQHWVGMALTVGGIAWVILERAPGDAGRLRRVPVGGILLALGAAAGQAGGLILARLGMENYGPPAATQIRAIAGLAGFAILYLFIGGWPRVFAAARDPLAIGYTAVGSFFGPALGVSLALAAVKYAKPGVAATIMALVPVFIIPPAILFRHERVTLRAAAGAVVAVAGSALLFLPPILAFG
ncbi:MAG: DMT family transporter [Planctomycetes bacterium]|nr:DMT family transporter [Planctomycetota bacterium]